MDWGWLVNIVWGWIVEVYNWFAYYIGVLWTYIVDLVGVINDAFKAVAAAIWWFANHLWRGILALRHLNFSRIWSALKRGYNRFLQAYDWWRRHVLAPLDRMRRQIWQIYRTFFKPLIMFIDSLRVFTRMIAIFNRKLAARLDHYLMGLEGKILTPITAMLHRLNAISSYFTALITTAGKLARPLLLESMRRDALLVWEVLTNPRALLYDKPPPARAPYTQQQAASDIRLYLQTGNGPVADYVRKAHEAIRETVMEVS